MGPAACFSAPGCRAETIDAHSGYDFPWSPARLLPFAATAPMHDYHHSHNKGSFGSQFMVWDWLFGTDTDFNAFHAKEKARLQFPFPAGRERERRKVN